MLMFPKANVEIFCIIFNMSSQTLKDFLKIYLSFKVKSSQV